MPKEQVFFFGCVLFFFWLGYLNVARVEVIYKSRSDTYTTAANGVTVDCRTIPLSSFSLQVSPTGNVTAWNVRLEGSLDNLTFITLLTHTEATGSGEVLVTGSVLAPYLYFRSRCATITLGSGTNVIATVVGKA